VSKIIPFSFQKFTIRTVRIGNEPYFVAKDLAEVLGLKDSKGAIRDLRKRYEENGIDLEGVILTHPLQTEGGVQNLTVVSEIGLYEFVFASRKSLAVVFRHWVASEVLPSIRKTGSYSISQTSNLQKIEERAKLIALFRDVFFNFKDVFLELGITRLEELAITCNRAVKEETGMDFLKIAKKEGVQTEENFITVTELCEIVRKGEYSDEVKASVSTKDLSKPNPRKLNLILQEKGFQTRNEKVWEATEKGKKFSDFVQNKSKTSEKTVYHLTWKDEVLIELF
jgi:prophage antirepressor-like protein